MNRKYLAFDIETAKDVPGEGFNWKPHRPLGICCAAALPSDAKEPILWHGKNPDGTSGPRMSRSDAANIVQELVRFVADGYTLLAWNGLGFDFDILSEESDCRDQCKERRGTNSTMNLQRGWLRGRIREVSSPLR